MNERRRDIGGRTLRGMLWAFASYGGGRLLVLVATAILARLLTPEDFGLVAAALTIIALFDSVSSLGLGQALIIQGDEDVYEQAETAFIGSIAAGFMTTVVIAAISPLIADFFHQPELVGISIALGVNFFLRSIGITHYSLAQRSLDFRARTIAELTEASVRGVTGIALALAGAGAWSLVIGYLVGTTALNIVIWVLVDWRPRFAPKRAHLRNLVGFGGTLTAVDVTAGLIGTVDSVFVGRVLGTAALGVYNIAYAIPRQGITNLAVVAGKVLFPAFAAYDKAGMRNPFLVSLRYTWLLALAPTILLAILAEPVILLAFGDQWGAAVEPMQILVVLGFVAATGFPAGTVYKATGRAGVLLRLALTRLVLVTVALAIFTDQGVTAAAGCAAGAALVVEAVNLVLASRLLDAGMRAIWSQIAPCIAAGIVMAVPVWAVGRLVEPALPAVLLGTAAGFAAYLGTLHFVSPEALRFLRRRLAAPKPAPAEVEV